MDVYLEMGKKAVIAGAMDWPGWCRKAKDEASALQALVDYAPRYFSALETDGAFDAPGSLPQTAADFTVVERLPGGSTTDFGAPEATPEADRRPLDPAEAERLAKILTAGWQRLDQVRAQADGQTLRLGPRGGGRDLEKILRHLYESEGGYLGSLGFKYQADSGLELEAAMLDTRRAVLAAVADSVGAGEPGTGPRGGKRWWPRYFVRRLAWHLWDHIWEIEDRLT